MKNRTKKLTALLAAVVLFAAFVIGCQKPGVDTPSSSSTQNDSQSGTGTEAITDQEYTSSLEKKDFDGRTFTFMTWEYGTATSAGDILVVEGFPMTDQMMEAVNTRNYSMMDKYNLEFDVYMVHRDSLVTEMDLLVTSGDHDVIDAGFPAQTYALAMGINGNLLNVNDLPHIDFEKPWWYENVLEETSICGENYFLQGMINARQWTQLHTVLFNKNLAKDLGYKVEDFYAYVDKGEWTFDKYAEIALNHYVDLDKDGVRSAGDQYGHASNNICAEVFIAGAEISFVNKDENDELVLEINERIYDFYSKMVEFTSDDSIMMGDHTIFSQISRNTVPLAAFEEGRSIFYMNHLGVIEEQLRDMADEYGVLPLPKYNEAQKDYTTAGHYANGSCIVLPIFCDYENVSYILEDMGYYSYKTVYPAYFDVVLEAKLTNDSEDYRMIEILLNKSQYDLACMLYANGFRLVSGEIRGAISNNNADLASLFAQNFSKYNEILSGINAKVYENMNNSVTE